jgi:hypothetical protein
LVAIADFGTRKVPDLLWAPAIFAGIYFYATSAFVVQVYALPFIGASIVVSGVIFATFRSKGFGGADSIAIVAASFFPFLLVAAVLPSMVISYIGIKLHLWGGAGVPVAGLIGLLSVAVLLAYVFL